MAERRSSRMRIAVAIGAWLLLAVLIWFLGPYFSFGESRPFATVASRIVTVLILLAAIVIWLLVAELLAARRSSKLAGAMQAQEDAPELQREESRTGEESAERHALQHSFGDAIAYLRKQGGHAKDLYRLPWFVIIGPPGSGKTTALVNSGLRFPLEERFGRTAARGVGGTRNCDWWFTDEAVFLDTAGRFTTQDSDHIADGAAWREFLRLLRRYRGKRPLNGVLLTVSVPELIESSRSERDALQESMCRRLVELRESFRIDLPVYLLITKSDLLNGFKEFFDELGPDGRKQVWGITFPLDESRARVASRSFGDRYDQLIGRLYDLTLKRLEEERSVSRRSAILGFPQEAASLKESLQGLLEGVFSGTESTTPMLRGIYFTSGTQQGEPIDRVVAAVARGLQVEPDQPRTDTEGRAYFINRLLKDVVLRESGLAGVNQRLALLGWGGRIAGYVGIVAATVLIVTWMFNSYRLNSNYLDDVNERGAEATAEKRPDRIVSGPAIESVLPRLDALRDVADFAAAPVNDASWSMRAGLYQADTVSDVAYDAYYRELDQLLRPVLAEVLATGLRDASTSPERLFEYLKGYLMLGDPQRLDPEYLELLLRIEFERSLGADPAVAGAERHISTWLGRGSDVAPTRLDDQLVQSARFALRRASVGRLIYSRLRFAHGAPSSEGIRLDEASGLRADEVLRRRSGTSLSEPISPLFTKSVFKEVTGTGAAVLAKEFNEERWVLGDSFPATEALSAVAEALELYEDEYLSTWDSLLRDVTVVSTSGREETQAVLAVLSSPTSPLKGFLETVAEQTDLVSAAAPDEARPQGALSRLEQATRGVAGGALEGLAAGRRPGARVTRHFADVHALFDGPPGATPMDLLLKSLGDVASKLAALGAANTATLSEALQQTLAGSGIKRQMPDAVSGMLSDLEGQSRRVVSQIVRSELQSDYEQSVTRPCLEIAPGRYPFMRFSGDDVPLLDFARLFGPGGIFATFFEQRLANLVDTSREPWTWRPAARGGLGTAALAQFEKARRIQEHYFVGSDMPKFSFTLTPRALDPSVLRFLLEIDGQRLEYRHGPQQPVTMNWPGPVRGGATAVFETTGGARPSIVRDGPWALFRLLDQAEIRELSASEFLVVFDVRGFKVELLLEAMSIRNPLADDAVIGFRCGG